MMGPLVVSASNLSEAWANAFLELMGTSGGQRNPALITIDCQAGRDSIGTDPIRTRLDAELRKHRLNSCDTVAGTIFPRSMWNPEMKREAENLYRRYEKAWPGIEKCPANRRGVYFRRLTAYAPAHYEGAPINQLESIVDSYRSGNHRKSALQAAILDPTRDHTKSRQQGFPCMQQVAFTPLGKDSMSVTGYYATQYQFEKAYGNYLGLYWLGSFMAKQLDMKLSRITCVASVLSLGDQGKTELRELEIDVRRTLGSKDGDHEAR